jgi:predicted Rossmann-fold nucleotide-binding protein
MYRVFGCTGEVSGDVIIQALLMAYDGNVDVINLSLGADDAWSESSDAENEVVNKIAAKGVSVVISAGNDGAMGAFTLGQPSTAVNAFSIASIDNAYYTSESFNATGVDHTIRKFLFFFSM